MCILVDAVAAENRDMVKYLLTCGARVNTNVPLTYLGPLHSAMDASMVKYLLRRASVSSNFRGVGTHKQQ
jgi:hypothetical protein